MRAAAWPGRRSDAAAGIAPEPDEWEMDVGIARSAIRLMAEVHG